MVTEKQASSGFVISPDPDNPTYFKAPTFAFGDSNGMKVIKWDFTKEFENVSPKGELIIKYNIYIGSQSTHCEANKFPCYRFIPEVQYVWHDHSDSQSTIGFTAFYKLDYGDNTGLTLIHDADTLPKFIATNLGMQAIQRGKRKLMLLQTGRLAK